MRSRWLGDFPPNPPPLGANGPSVGCGPALMLARLPPLALLRTVGRTVSPSRPPHPRQYLPQAWLACLGRVVIFIPLIVPDSAWGHVTQSPGVTRGSRGGSESAVLAGNPNGTIASLTRYRCALTLTASKLGTPSAYLTAHGENACTPAAGTGSVSITRPRHHPSLHLLQHPILSSLSNYTPSLLSRYWCCPYPPPSHEPYPPIVALQFIAPAIPARHFVRQPRRPVPPVSVRPRTHRHRL